MVELDQFRYRISGYDKPMAQIKNSLDLDNKQKRIEELEADMESPGFWDNPDKSQNAMKELKGLKDAFERYNELETGLDDVKTLIERHQAQCVPASLRFQKLPPAVLLLFQRPLRSSLRAAATFWSVSAVFHRRSGSRTPGTGIPLFLRFSCVL